jgi:hypothetical protein
MGTLILGLAIGLVAGFVLGRRQVGAPPDDRPAAPLPVPRVTPAAAPAPVGVPNKHGQKVGFTEADFTPSDDILDRMRLAWEHGVSLEQLDTLPLVGVPAKADAGGQPAVEPEGVDRLQRVLGRLDGRSDEQGGDVDHENGPEQASTASTVTEAITELSAEGYGNDLRLDGDVVACRACGGTHPTAVIEVDRVLRFEGPSDPADEAIVLALRCPHCGARGALVSAFGPDADPALAGAFVYLASRARHR